MPVNLNDNQQIPLNSSYVNRCWNSIQDRDGNNCSLAKIITMIAFPLILIVAVLLDCFSNRGQNEQQESRLDRAPYLHSPQQQNYPRGVSAVSQRQFPVRRPSPALPYSVPRDNYFPLPAPIQPQRVPSMSVPFGANEYNISSVDRGNLYSVARAESIPIHAQNIRTSEIPQANSSRNAQYAAPPPLQGMGGLPRQINNRPIIISEQEVPTAGMLREGPDAPPPSQMPQASRALRADQSESSRGTLPASQIVPIPTFSQTDRPRIISLQQALAAPPPLQVPLAMSENPVSSILNTSHLNQQNRLNRSSQERLPQSVNTPGALSSSSAKIKYGMPPPLQR